MNIRPLVLIALLSISTLVISKELSTLKEFQTLINDNTKCAVIKFYAPWCSACKHMNPVFDGAEKEHPTINFLSIDITKKEFSDLADTLGIQGVPTVIYKEVGYQDKANFTKRLSGFLAAPAKVPEVAKSKKTKVAQAKKPARPKSGARA